MESLVLNNLEWPLLLQKLSDQAQTEAGRECCSSLPLNLTRDEIEKRWRDVEPLKELVRQGYKAPIGDLPEMDGYFRAAHLGQILTGEALRAVYLLCTTVKLIHRFTTDFKGRCAPLDRFHRTIYPLPKLSQAIEKAISPEGEILDEASPELRNIRRSKLAMRRKIEQQIRQLLVDQELEPYLQDKFFTIRSERYVVPMRLDGRGRIKGSIYDTSDSGQTLFIEPSAIAPLNEELLELELSEKLEILRIFRELSAQVAEEHDVLVSNYSNLVELDILTAQAALAYTHDGVPVRIAHKPSLQLIEARHPLVTSPSGEAAVGNDIDLQAEQTTLVVSGPNAGGKTVVLKTVGILHLMMKAGLLLPCARESEIYLYDKIYLAMGDTQSLTANLSTFSGHLLSLKPILEKARPRDLVLLDELAIGTEPQTGSAIAQAILEKLADERIISIATTHYDTLKGLAVTDRRFRNGSMEFSSRNLKPTYNLILDLPGQSYGIEVAEHLGFPRDVISRARELRGQGASSLDQLVESLTAAREEARHEAEKMLAERRVMETQRAHWEKERQGLKEVRSDTAKKINERYEAEIDDLKAKFHATIEELKQQLKQLKESPHKAKEAEASLADAKVMGQGQLDDLNQHMGRLENEYRIQDIPGEACTIDDLDVGAEVYIISLKKEGVVTNITKGPHGNVEVQAGLLKIRPSVDELRLLRRKTEPTPAAGKKIKGTSQPGRNQPEKVGMIIPTPTNSLDLRGMDSERAIQLMWQFVDRAVMRGEPHLVVIHGHGTDTLKKSIRLALAKGPYSVNFRPGEANEGGDGVTVLSLEH